jgi:VWFA-related protein
MGQVPHMKRVAPVLVCLTLAAALVTGLAAQQAPVFRSASQTVAIYATVLDRDGRLVPDLLQEHFEVLDNGKPQPLTIFKSDVQPITVVAMLDVSGSMTLNLDRLKVAAEQFVLRLLPEDQARIGSFSDRINIYPSRFTNNRDQLIRIVHNDMGFGNPTHLWDAIDESMTALANESGRRVVLVFTDGEDQRSRHVGFDEVLARAQTEGFMIYAIGMESYLPAINLRTRPDRKLRRLAEETGGGYFELKEKDDLNSTFTRVADELHRQYVLGFDVPVLDGAVHLLDVRVKVPGMTARARKSYVAAASATLGPVGAP